MTLTLQMLIITAMVSIVFLTGFPFEIDAIINKHFPLYHLPDKPFLCNTCAVFWTLVIWLLITGNISLTSILGALLLAYFAPTISNLLALIKRCVDKILEATMRFID